MTPERAPRDEEGRVGRWLPNDPDGWWECDGSAPARCVWLHGPSIAACGACGTKRPPLPATPAPRVCKLCNDDGVVHSHEGDVLGPCPRCAETPKPSPRFLTDAQVVGREPIAGLEQARLVGDLKAAIERVADHRWIISTAYEGGNFGFQVNTRDAVQRGKKTVKYSPLPGSFALTAPDAALNGLRVEATPTPSEDRPDAE